MEMNEEQTFAEFAGMVEEGAQIVEESGYDPMECETFRNKYIELVGRLISVYHWAPVAVANIALDIWTDYLEHKYEVYH